MRKIIICQYKENVLLSLLFTQILSDKYKRWVLRSMSLPKKGRDDLNIFINIFVSRKAAKLAKENGKK